MADVFPPRVLPGRGEEWGRAVENRIQGGEKSEAQLEQKVDNGLRATNGQLAVLGEQIDQIVEAQNEIAVAQQDLSGRVSYGVFWNNNPFSVTSNVSDVPLTPLRVQFSTSVDRVVRIQTSVQVSATRGTGGNAFIRFDHEVDGSSPSISQTSGVFHMGTLAGSPMYAQLVLTTLMPLPAGSHTVTPVYGTRVTPSGTVTIDSGSTVVDILQA